MAHSLWQYVQTLFFSYAIRSSEITLGDKDSSTGQKSFESNYKYVEFHLKKIG